MHDYERILKTLTHTRILVKPFCDYFHMRDIASIGYLIIQCKIVNLTISCHYQRLKVQSKDNEIDS